MKRVAIYVPSGIYEEKVIIPATKQYLTLHGEGRNRTIITWHDIAASAMILMSASVIVEFDHFIARDISCRGKNLLNAEYSGTAAPASKTNMQAEAIRTSGTHCIREFLKILAELHCSWQRGCTSSTKKELPWQHHKTICFLDPTLPYHGHLVCRILVVPRANIPLLSTPIARWMPTLGPLVGKTGVCKNVKGLYFMGGMNVLEEPIQPVGLAGREN